MSEYYIAPSYRGYSILQDNIYEGVKRYGIIDYKGKEKKIRLWDKPQKGWVESAATKSAPLDKPHFEDLDGCRRVVGLKDTTLADMLGFGECGYVWLIDTRNSYGRKCAFEYMNSHPGEIRQSGNIGAYVCGPGVPCIQGVQFIRLDKEVVMLDDNTWRPKKEILDRLYEMRGTCILNTPIKWFVGDKEKFEAVRATKSAGVM